MPLRILLPTIGSSGDVHPIIELGRALRSRGHGVTVATNDLFREQIGANGLEFTSLGTAAEAAALMNDPRLWHPIKGFGCIVEGALLPNIPRLYRIIEDRLGSDLVVAASTLCLGARVAQEKLGVPTATIHLQPSVLRSHVDNGRLGPFDMGPGMPRPVKTGLFWLMDTFFSERLIGRELNAFRATLGLRPVHGIFSSYVHSPQLVLGLFPEWFAPRQPDWPVNTHLVGFVLHDAWGEREAHADAESFLASGSPPLLVTPGSAAVDRTEFFRTTVAACASAGARAMLVTNHPGQLPGNLPEGIRAFPYLPFSSVLPRCAAIVYHGGIGTLAQAVRAGIPHLVVPNAHDQPDNGQRIERIGLGFMLYPRKYTDARAARTLSELRRSKEIAGRCSEFVGRIDSAVSLERACTLIEGLS